MGLKISLTHRTHYRYDRRVRMGRQTIRLRPAPHCRATIHAYALRISPGDHFLAWQQDPMANWMARIDIPELTDHFEIVVDLVAELGIYNPFDFFSDERTAFYPLVYEHFERRELQPFLEVDPPGPLEQSLLAEIQTEGWRNTDLLVAINQLIQRRIDYIIRMEPGVQTPEETLALGRGSCRDSSWLLVNVLRHLGFAARFVSGYSVQLVPDLPPLDAPQTLHRDVVDLHAWVEVYIPGAGWIGFDPTSGLLATEGHIPLCATPNPGSASPISGTLEMCEATMEHSMELRRVDEAPRSTRPYSDEAWEAVNRLGHDVDARLRRGDVRLTMGGEPTFVSIDDRDSPEWTVAAVGPHKRRLSEELILALRDRFAPEGLLVFGQGKWYPGESLPRWALQLYWRKDGEPMWRARAPMVAPPRPAEVVDAEAFIDSLATRLGINPDYALPAFEDPWPAIAEERRLPDNIDPLTFDFGDNEERARLARQLEAGLGRVVGFVLPVQAWQGRDGRRWISEAWRFRSGRMYLVPGDSAMGLRLPLESLPWVSPASYPYIHPADPFEPREPLPKPDALDRQARIAGAPAPSGVSGPRPQRLIRQRGQPGPTGSFVRTAVCVEPRDGRLWVFLPPTETVEDYLALVAAVEHIADQQDLPVVIEGYPPPPDPRLNVIKVTPDPGVIEVNIHPAASWVEVVRNTETLYEAARSVRLDSEKYLIDGRQAGTGGGNHIVVGGASAPDSPFLRRPDLMGSLLRYWQNHPSLSYLFSGMFVGPTSQAPRIDEARDESIYELSLALAHLPPATVQAPPWLVDRTLRNILTDVTGNTHRAEICIDKLYSPDGPTGRLGLVEFRSFEMPPHARMSMVQQLLLRALIAWFWEQPYTRGLTRWGNGLRDRFMLPHFIWADFEEILGDLRAAGFDFDPSWFRAHYEFRFPLYGSVQHQGVTIELRQALEPWHVLGEEPGASGTVRFVDSSVERMQVRVTGLLPGRYLLACNGYRVPLTATATPGEFIAGVRFRAWWPAACLHPGVGIHAPLIFDLHDPHIGRSLGGCTYHVAHPGGRAFDELPINAWEAEGRRLARFQPFGHTPGGAPHPREVANPDFPLTLDLRWAQ